MFVDIHSHIAWDIDDGMDTKEHAIQALQNAKKDGIEAIVLTPHFIPGRHSSIDKVLMKKRMDEVKELAKEIGVNIYFGSEVFLNHEYLSMIEEEVFYSINNSKYVLVEFDVRKDIDNNDDAEDILYEIAIRNYVPIIAHVERYFHNGIDIERIQAWIKRGYVIQVNRTSLLGAHGTQNEDNAHELLKKGLVHVVASDVHSVESNRICKLSDVYMKIKSKYGKINADLLCTINPSHIIHDEEVERITAKQGLFARVFQKGVKK